MNRNYDTPLIEIIEFNDDIVTANASIVFDYPWIDDNDNDFFN